MHLSLERRTIRFPIGRPEFMFEGVRVIEVAEWTLVPAAGAVLAEFGADVIKVERPNGGDIQRGLAFSGITPAYNGTSLQMEVTNRGGKRSIGLDVRSEGGRDLLYRLVAGADVFLTSLLPKTRKRLGIDIDDIRTANPNIVYAYGHGVGTKGPDAEKGGYDMTAYWCRGGFAHAVTESDFPRPVRMRGATGDKFGAMNLVAGVASALFKRERTGEGSDVEVSLLGTAVWQISSDLVYSQALDIDNTREVRGTNPLVAYYECSDGRWLVLSLIESDRWWPGFAKLVGLEHLVDDPRFKDFASREANFAACTEVLAAHFKTRTLTEWRAQLADFGGPWEPLQTPAEVSADPQVLANEYLTTITAKSGVEVPVVPAPIRFDGKVGRLDPCPEAGEHTEEILLELGDDWDSIIRYKDAGYIQ
jgi:crotonobetainyl-CoA:carnitine CoA-transferase CaiB-like acyl-CoA transferase